MELLKALTDTEQGYLKDLLSDPIKRLTLHSDIELTENEIAEALIKAKSAKSVRLEYDHRIMARRRFADEIIKPFNVDQLLEYCHKFYITRFGHPFNVDSDNKPLVEMLALYFTGNDKFNKEGYNLNKGLLIMGNVGTGKTEVMKFFQKNKKICYQIVQCNKVADDYLILKEELEETYSTPTLNPLNDPTFFFQKHIGFCFDDLGTEENKNAYGNKKNVMADVIMAIYNKKRFPFFHITTNLANKKEIEDRYGTRVNSRLREMFNVFSLDGPDRRK